MGGGSWTRNKRINDAVATRAALRPSPSAVQGKNISQVTEPPVFTYNTGDPLPEGYRSPAKFYSEMTPAEQRANDELSRLAELNKPDPSVYVPTTYSQGLTSQNYGAAPTYDSAEEAFSTYGSFLNEVQGQMAQTASVYNYNQFDPGDFARAGMSSPRSAGNAAASDRVSEYLLKNNIPPFIEKDGQKLYFTTGLNEDALAKTLGDDYKASGSYKAYGPAGTYSTVYQKPESVLSSINPVVRAALGVATGGLSEGFITGAKAISGETLHGGDYLSLAVPALQKSGMLVPPEAGATGAAAAGKGIAGLGYADSVGLLSAAATGDPTSFIVSKFGNEALDKAFEDIPVDSDLLGRFQADDVKAGMVKVVDKLAGGADFDEALVAGLGKYVTEGGGLNLDGMDVDLGIVEDLAKAVVKQLEPIGDALSAADTAVRQGLSEFDDEVLQEFTQPVGDVLSSADTAVRQNLATFDEEVLQPITQPVGDIIEDVGQAIGDAFSGLNFNPNLGQFRLVSDTGVSTPSPTRTTDQIFGDDLFKFETEIGISYPNEEEYVDLEANPFNDSLELELTYPDSTEESDGFFEGTIYEQQPRSYNF